MVGFVRVLSAIIGFLFIVQAAVLALMCALIATPFTFALGTTWGLIMGLGGMMGGEQAGNAALKRASDFSWSIIRWAFDLISVLLQRFAKLLRGGNPSAQEVKSPTEMIVKDWPAWSWCVLVGDWNMNTPSGVKPYPSAFIQQAGGFPSIEVAENSLRELVIQREKRVPLGEYERNISDEMTRLVAARAAEIESVKNTSASVMTVIIVVVDLLAIISLIIRLSV
jgi:hypothetical protein